MSSWAIGILTYLFLAALFYLILAKTARPESRRGNSQDTEKDDLI